MQLNPNQILAEGVLKPCEFTKIQQVGIDLTVSEAVELEHGHSANILLNEIVCLPIDMFSLLIQRSSYNRRGVQIVGSVYDPGYNGVVGCTLYNMSGSTLSIPKNERVAQMVFFAADAASEYQGQYQGEHLS